MNAILLAAGRGERLRPLTDTTPKPLLDIGGTTLIEHQLGKLVQAGISEVVINLRHLGNQIQSKLGDGRAYDLRIEYSVESQRLETGGGIKNALSILGDEPFLVVSADTYTDYDYSLLISGLPDLSLGLLLMTDNPVHHLAGDFAIDTDDVLQFEGQKYTYTGISVLSPELVRNVPEQSFTLRKVFDQAISDRRLHGTLHDGYWCDVGTSERLQALRQKMSGTA